MNHNENILGDYHLYLAGTGKLARTIVQETKGIFKDIVIGERSRNGDMQGSYEIGNLSGQFPSKKIVGVITCTAHGVEGALHDFQNIPTLIASSAYPDSLVPFMRRTGSEKILEVPNLAIAVAELQAIFEVQESFDGMIMRIHESHQSGKKDPSGTALKMREIFVSKGGVCEYEGSENYNPQEGMSYMGDIYSYRGSASSELLVPRDHMGAHAYHDYDISGSGENYNIFTKSVLDWHDRNELNNCDNIRIHAQDNNNGSLSLFHNIGGREVYAQGLLEILPWFLTQEKKVLDIVDYIKYKKTVGQSS